jgi:hypothetical protein
MMCLKGGNIVDNEIQNNEVNSQMNGTIKHSGLGIAAFIIAAAAIAFVFIGMILIIGVGAATIQEIAEGTMTEDELITQAPMLIIGVLFFMFAVFAAFIGGILGIVALVQKNRKKLFAILGTIINWLIVLFVIFSMVTGLILQ